MNKLKMQIENNLDIYLSNTMIENLFINEFLPSATGDCVKVYIFGMMYAQHNQEMDIEKMAKALNLSIQEVTEAFEYWARRGAVRIIPDQERQDFTVVFVSQVNALYGLHDEKPSTEKTIVIDEKAERFSALMDEELRALYSEYEGVVGRLVSLKEMDKIKDSIYTYNITPDVMSYAMQYCKELEKYNIDYIAKVALRWSEDGCKTILDVKELLDKHSKRSAYYGMIFKQMGFTRLTNPADREMMDRWFDDWNYSIGDVLEACKKTAGQREPSLKYVNRILENKYLEAGGIVIKRNDGKVVSADDIVKQERAKVSQNVLNDYYAYLRHMADASLDARIDEVCKNVAEMRIVFEKENELSNELLNLKFGENGKEKRAMMREKKAQLNEEKKKVLIANGYSEDFLERKYKCPICKDTGTTDEGRICACTRARADEAYLWHKDR